MLAALVPIAVGRSPWIHIGIGLLLIGGVSAMFNLRDALVLGLRRLGRNPDPDRIFKHICATVLVAVIVPMLFGTDDPRLQGSAPWLYVIGAGLMVYLFSFLYDKTMRAMAWLIDRLSGDR
jgi:peptidoglycan/LPS O-acetylase OafA/YrhL